MTVLRLYVEEARALPRARFALAGAATLAALLTTLAAFMGTGPGGMYGFAVMAYMIAPALFAGVAAAQMSGLRTSRFTHSLYTAPVRKGDVLAAKALVSLTVAGAYLLATLPFFAVAAAHVGVRDYVPAFLLVGGGLLLFAVALGTLLGVLFTGRSSVAPVALGVGFLALSLFALPLAGAIHAQPGEPDATLLRALHVSPHLLLSDAAGILARATGEASASPALAGALVALESVALFAAAAWAYLREQGVEGWESPPSRRTLLAGLVVLTMLAPAAAADVEYVEAPRRETGARMAWGDDRNGTAHLVRPSAPASEASFGDFFAGTRDDPLDVGRANARDVLILLPLPEDARLRDVRARIVGRDGMLVSGPAEHDLGDLDRPETARGASGSDGPVVRIPAAFAPTAPHDPGVNWYSAGVVLTYRLEGELAPRTVEVSFAVRADVPHAPLQMALAGLPLVLVPAAASVVRRVRVG